METRVLYRPIGVKELELIAQTGFKAFPPRLPFQPIFYPVVNFEYAEQIAKDWNTKDPASGYAGFVTRFAVELWDVGTGWVQPAELQIRGAVLPAALPELSDYILSGELRVGDQGIGFLPLPFYVEGEVEFQAVLGEGDMVTVKGCGASIVLLGEAWYMEEVLGPIRLKEKHPNELSAF